MVAEMSVAAVENPVLDKIVSFMNDNSYTELTQNTAKFNVRIRRDRRYRQPYIDGQTGVAQRDCHLFVSIRQRQPGQVQGQVFSYPERRWRAPHRSYLRAFVQPPAIERDPEEHIITTVENPAAISAAAGGGVGVVTGVGVVPGAVTANSNGTLEPESLAEKDAWAYYEDNGFDELEEDIETDDNDDDETYDRKGSRKKKSGGKKSKKKTPKRPQPKTPKTSTVGGKKSRAVAVVDDNDDPESKPYHCERKSGRKGGSHKHTESSKPPNNHQSSIGPNSASAGTVSSAHLDLSSQNGGGDASCGGNMAAIAPDKKKVTPSPYCDFCLGDSSINKKTMSAESLVSCADCGRSGHPTCLQFTANMMKSVSNYRWQCIECKTCTLCGTSENDDQLLFCDDCDRGYHLYCLSPPLAEPPEGEWSCSLCIKHFHGSKLK